MFGPDSRQVGVDGDRSDFNDEAPAPADQRGDIPTPPVPSRRGGRGRAGPGRLSSSLLVLLLYY